jgi:hypothetical protein
MPAPIPVNDQILALHEAGVPTRQIERVIGTLDHSTIARRLKQLTPRRTTQIYRELKADILAEKQRKLLMDARQADPREQDQLSRAFKVYHEAEKAERGEAVNIIQIDLSDRLREALKRSQSARNGVETGKTIDHSTGKIVE